MTLEQLREAAAKIAEDFEGTAAMERSDDPLSAAGGAIADLIRAIPLPAIAALPKAGEVDGEPTWPEWASELLKIMREYTGPCPEDGYEGVDLPEELRTWFEGYRDELIRTGSLVKSPAPAAAVDDGELRCRIQDALLATLGSTYDCTRVWYAWGVGTMGEDDFRPVLDRLDELVDEIAAAVPAPPSAIPAAAVGELHERIMQGMWASESEEGDLHSSFRLGTFQRLAHAAIRALPTPSEGLTERYREALEKVKGAALSNWPAYKIADEALATPEKDAQ